MSERKRKHHEGQENRPKKRAATDKLSGVLKVNWLEGSKEISPAIVTSPGLSLPSDVKFEPYTKEDEKPELLLHSSTHPSIDYIAQDENDGLDTKHYIAVYDSSAKTLKITEAKYLTARASVRQPPLNSDSDSSSSETEKTPIPNSSQRANLIEAFGTKKSKKTYAAQLDNRLLSRDDRATQNPVSSALLSSLPTSQLLDPAISNEQLIRENKPLPRANLSADSVQDVYPLKSLVHPSPGLRTLSSLPIDEWLESAASRKPITAPSKYIANRISPIAFTAATSPDKSTAKETATLHLRTLRYILLLLNLHRLATTTGRGHDLPYNIKRWSSGIAGPGTIPQSILEGLRRQYIPEGGKMRNYDLNLLRATICAMTLHIPPPPGAANDAGTLVSGKPSELVTHPGDVREDMALEASVIRKIFREMGCRMEKLDERGMERWGVKVYGSGRSKVKEEEEDENEDEDEGTKARRKRRQNLDKEIAKLKLPLGFPGKKKARFR